ncbi:MAG: ABC transporter permease [Deltaproteobacteria bacterium]|nr:ABC transporter permease [Deltaproteobacteria bacterium]
MNWRRLRTLMRREVQATFRDPFTITVLITVPLAALLAFGFTLATDVRHLALGVYDAAGTAASRRLVAELAAQSAFDPRQYARRDELEHALVAGDIGAAIVIPPGFERHRRGGRPQPSEIQLLYDGGEAVLAGNAEAFMRSLLSATAGELAGPPSVRRAGIAVVTRAVFNPRLDGKPFMVAGTFGFVLSFLTVLITAVSIVNEKLTGTFEQLQVTPANAVEIVLGKILPLGAVFAVDVVLMVLLAGAVLQVWPAGSVMLFVVISSFYVLVSLSMGLIISATSHTAAEAVQKSVILSIPLVQLSGFAFPTRNMPWIVQWVAELFPATHYIRVSRAIYMRGEGFLSLLPELALLLLFGVILMAYALRTVEART